MFSLKLWTMNYDCKDIFKFDNASDNWQGNYICNIIELLCPLIYMKLLSTVLKILILKTLKYLDIYFLEFREKEQDKD